MDKDTLSKIEDLLYIAGRCAGKLKASLTRGEISPRMEFEQLAEKYSEIIDLRSALRGVTATPNDAMDAGELAEFAQTVEDFDDNGETSTPYDVLMLWAEQGYLDCDHFVVTDKGRTLLGGEGIPHFSTPGNLANGEPNSSTDSDAET